jgi:hypothetical protein
MNTAEQAWRGQLAAITMADMMAEASRFGRPRSAMARQNQR